MGLKKDISHLLNIARYGMKTRPSRITEAQRLQRIKQIAWRRAQAGAIKNVYLPGAEISAMRGDWAATINTATSIIRSDYMTLCARSELAYRTDVWARRAIQVLSSYIVGQGIKPYPIIKMANGNIAETPTRALAQDWERFNDQGMRNGSQQITMYQGQDLEFRTIAVYGNSLCNIISAKPGSWLRYAMQIIKPTRLDFSKDNYYDGNSYQTQNKPKIVHGMELNDFGEAVNFYLQGYEKPFPSDKMRIAYYPIETEAYMGLPWLTPSLGNIYDNQQIFEDKMKQSRIGSRLGYRINKKDQDSFEASIDSVSEGGSEYIDLDYQGFVSSDGEITPVKLDDSLKESFLPLLRGNLIALGVGMGFSYQLLTTDLEGSNFASSQTNALNDNRFFRTVFKWYTKTVLQRRYEKFVEWEILQGKIPGVSYQNFLDDPWYYTQCFWLPIDGEQWVDPLKDAKATELLYNLGQITYQEICATGGKDYKSVLKQLSKEKEEMTALGLERLLPSAGKGQGNNLQTQIDQTISDNNANNANDNSGV
jgi:capsid protein